MFCNEKSKLNSYFFKNNILTRLSDFPELMEYPFSFSLSSISFDEFESEA
jgi:hypothetical protein